MAAVVAAVAVVAEATDHRRLRHRIVMIETEIVTTMVGTITETPISLPERAAETTTTVGIAMNGSRRLGTSEIATMTSMTMRRHLLGMTIAIVITATPIITTTKTLRQAAAAAAGIVRTMIATIGSASTSETGTTMTEHRRRRLATISMSVMRGIAMLPQQRHRRRPVVVGAVAASTILHPAAQGGPLLSCRRRHRREKDTETER